MPIMNGTIQETKELAKWLLAAWQWTFVVGAADFCLPSPSMLNIAQFSDEAADVKDCVAWLLAYVQALQCMGEAAEGRRWCPKNGLHFFIQMSPLVDAFIIDGCGADQDGDQVMLEPGGHTDTITEEGWPLHRHHHLPG